MSFLFVALDYPDFQHAYHMIRQLDDLEMDFGYKLNLDFIVTNTNFKVQDLGTNRPVFADMKMWNGARTMTETCLALQHKGFGFTNIHSLCGFDMMTELMEEVRKFPAPRIKIFGLTILTHYDNNYCSEQFKRGMELEIIKLVGDIVDSRLDGTILPGAFLRELKDIKIAKIIPAVRPKVYEEKRKDQKQTITAHDAVLNGADYLVCGSPITKANNPREALENILRETETI